MVAVVCAMTASPAINSSYAQETTEKQETEEEEPEEEDEEEEETVEDLMRDAMRAARSGETEEAIEIIEEAYKMEPENFQIQASLVQMLQQHAGQVSQTAEREDANPHYYRSADVARELMENEEAMDQFGPQIKQMCSTVIYNEACCLSIDGKNEKAMAALKEAFELGFSDFELAKSDSDFENIHGDVFDKLIKKSREAAIARMIEETKSELADFESFDFDFELEDVKGEMVSLGDFAGKVTIVDFWGTWCPPCREEIPSFIKLKKTYGSKGFDIVGINYEGVEGEEAVEKITEFMEDHEMNYNCLIGDDETSDQVDIEGYPTTLFIDAKGKVRMKMVGLHSYEKLEAVVKILLEENQGG